MRKGANSLLKVLLTREKREDFEALSSNCLLIFKPKYPYTKAMLDDYWTKMNEIFSDLGLSNKLEHEMLAYDFNSFKEGIITCEQFNEKYNETKIDIAKVLENLQQAEDEAFKDFNNLYNRYFRGKGDLFSCICRNIEFKQYLFEILDALKEELILALSKYIESEEFEAFMNECFKVFNPKTFFSEAKKIIRKDWPLMKQKLDYYGYEMGDFNTAFELFIKGQIDVQQLSEELKDCRKRINSVYNYRFLIRDAAIKQFEDAFRNYNELEHSLSATICLSKKFECCFTDFLME